MSGISKHPILFIANFCGLDSSCKLEFGVYTYKPQTIKDSREIVRVNANKMQKEYENLLENLDPDKDVALHSRVSMKDEANTLHIPMIDFNYSVTISNHFPEIIKLTSDFGCETVALFDSGRSYHLYGNALLKPEEWQKFMGRLLLLNQPNQEKVVDSRWIGHRLLSGYSSLRWSNNSTQYLQEPSCCNLIISI